MIMGNYRLTPEAEEDLWRIYHWGFREHGEVAADKYYPPFLIGLNNLQSNRFYIKAVTIYGKDIGNAFAGWIRSIIVLLVMQLRLRMFYGFSSFFNFTLKRDASIIASE